MSSPLNPSPSNSYFSMAVQGITAAASAVTSTVSGALEYAGLRSSTNEAANAALENTRRARSNDFEGAAARLQQARETLDNTSTAENKLQELKTQKVVFSKIQK